MSRPIISAEGLSKAYRIGVELERAGTLTGAAIGMLKAPVRNFRRLRRLNTYAVGDDSPDIYWALKDVSFEIEEGEVVGIIGRNGAGKSTLLKLLSRITDPTRGRAVLRGRVSSLLEVGTGFHPELTGRENVYLNGTILGMTKREVDRKFDEIVEFSGVEKFLDTPIKRYSSGMTVRLAFAVAAHLEPEILVIDEVLAVGDAEFQKKCLGKMQDVAKGGRTVLFVSHNTAAVQSLCTKGILLSRGSVRMIGPATEVLQEYLRSRICIKDQDLASAPIKRSGDGRVLIKHIHFEDRYGNLLTNAHSGAHISVVVTCEKRSEPCLPLPRIDVGISFHNHFDQMLFATYSSTLGSYYECSGDTAVARCVIDRLPLTPGVYNIGARLVHNGIELDWPREYLSELSVEPGDFYGTGRGYNDQGALFLVDCAWR